MEEVQGWVDSLRKQAEVIRYLVALNPQDTANEGLSLAQADTLDATADGWESILNAASNTTPEQ